MAAGYELRTGDVKSKKQSMNDLKLRRLNELNLRLREDLDRPRIKVSEASMRFVILDPYSLPKRKMACVDMDLDSLISYCNNTKDFMVPSIWGPVSGCASPRPLSLM